MSEVKKLNRTVGLKKVVCRVITVILLNSFVVTGSLAQSVTLATLDWPPYIGPGLKNNGYVTEIVKAAFAQSRAKVDIEYMPWARAVKVTSEGKRDGLFPEYYSSERAVTHAYSDPFPGGPVGFLKRTDRKITYSSLRKLSNLKIGVVRGYINSEEFDNAHYLDKDSVSSDLLNIRKLARKRVDLIVIDKFVAKFIIENESPDSVCSLEFIEPALENKNLYIAFSKKAANYESKLAAFNKGLKIIKTNGQLKSILRRHNF